MAGPWDDFRAPAAPAAGEAPPWQDFATAAPPPQRKVGFIDSALRTAGLVARQVVGVVDQAAAGLAGLAGDTAGQDEIFRNMDLRQQRMAEEYAPQPGEKFNRAGEFLGGAAMMGAGLMVAGSGAGGEERAREVIQRGGSTEDAVRAGGVQAAGDAALAALPLGVGRVAGRTAKTALGQGATGAATGLAVNVPAGVGARAAANEALPEGPQFEDLKQPLAPDAAEVGMTAVLGAAGGATGARAAGRRAEAATAKTAAQARADKLDAPRLEQMERFREAGFVLTPSEAKAGKTSRTIEGLAGEPKLAKAASERNAETVNNLVREDLGLAADVPLSRQALADIRTEEGKAYEAVKNVGRVKVGAKFQKALDEVEKAYDTAAESFEHRTEKPFQRVMDGLRGKKGEDGTVTPRSEFAATAAVEEVKLLRNDADKAYRAGDKALGKAYRKMAEALDDAVDAHLQEAAKTNPKLANVVADYRKARVRIAKTYTADKALNDATGNIDAAVYGRELKKGVPLAGKAQLVAEFAQAHPRLVQRTEKVGNTGPTIMDAGLALVGKEALMLGARPAARAGLLTKTAQDLFVQRPKPKGPAPAEPELTAGQTPFPARPAAVAESPLGDLTPDWDTTRGAAPARGREEVVPADDLVPAVGDGMPPARVVRSGDARDASPARRAGEQVPAVPGRPDLPDTMVAGEPREVAADAATGEAMQSDDAQLARSQQRPSDEPIPAGEATDIEMPDPRLLELERLQATAQSPTAKKALASEAAKIKKELKDQANARAREDDIDELRRLAARAETPALRASLEAQAAKLEGKIPAGEATELPSEPATGRAPDAKPLPVGEATEVTNSGVEPVEKIPAGEARELLPPLKKEATNAAREVPKQEGVQQERGGGDEGGKAPEAGGGNRVQRGTPGEGEEAAAKTRSRKVPEGVTIKERDHGFEVFGPDGKMIGYLRDNLRRGQAEQIGENASVDMVKVEPAWRGKGIADALYRAFAERHGGRIAISGKTEAPAMRVWKRLFPEKVNEYVEQEAKRIRDGAPRELVLGNIKDTEVRTRVAEASSTKGKE
jgi:GNAT superfamily N-acetyltransferase